MADFRYAQFCPVARAAEVLGERWTLLVVRELMIGPQRFSDLMRRLEGVSSSVLSARVRHLEERGVARRRRLPPPAASSVIELTELGQALRPVMLALTTWGIRLMQPRRPADHFEPSWITLGLIVILQRAPCPDRYFVLRAPDVDQEVVMHLAGGPEGARLLDAPPASGRAPDAEIRGDAALFLHMAVGAVDPHEALERGEIQVSGDTASLSDLPALFTLEAIQSATPNRAAAGQAPANPQGAS